MAEVRSSLANFVAAFRLATNEWPVQSGAAVLLDSGAFCGTAVSIQVADLLSSGLARERVNRLPLFCGKLNFPSRHVFFQVRKR